jgi:sugar/nucleoside kinase (ribokinase family)
VTAALKPAGVPARTPIGTAENPAMDAGVRLWPVSGVIGSLHVRAELVTAGEAFEDLIFYDLPRLPRAGEELKTSRFARAPGGGAIITAVTAARLGLRTTVISAVGDLARAALRREGVTLRNLLRPGEAPALTAALSTARDRSFVTFNGVNDRLEPRLLAAVPRTEAVHVHCALYPKNCTRWVRVIAGLRRRGRTVSWDFGWNPDLARDRSFPALLGALDVVFVNEAEARLYSGKRSLDAALEWWRRTAPRTVVKLGRRGASCLSAHAVLRAPAPRVEAVDTTGAGDAFNGGYLAALVRGGGVAECLRSGNAAGARSTKRAGGL